MSITINLRHLDKHSVRLNGELPAEELDIETLDDMIQLGPPLQYDLEVEKLDEGLLVEGSLDLVLRCQCVRCLRPCEYRIHLPEWKSHLPLAGEDAVPINNDLVDLTPILREDILLDFPQHPLCNPECGGLPTEDLGQTSSSHTSGTAGPGPSAWAELNKLKFDN